MLDSGYVMLYRYNPDRAAEGKNPLVLDSGPLLCCHFDGVDYWPNQADPTWTSPPTACTSSWRPKPASQASTSPTPTMPTPSMTPLPRYAILLYVQFLFVLLFGITRARTWWTASTVLMPCPACKHSLSSHFSSIIYHLFLLNCWWLVVTGINTITTLKYKTSSYITT